MIREGQMQKQEGETQKQEEQGPEPVAEVVREDSKDEVLIDALETLNPTPYTLHPTPSTLHHQPYTLNPTGLDRCSRNDGCS